MKSFFVTFLPLNNKKEACPFFGNVRRSSTLPGSYNTAKMIIFPVSLKYFHLSMCQVEALPFLGSKSSDRINCTVKCSTFLILALAFLKYCTHNLHSLPRYIKSDNIQPKALYKTMNASIPEFLQ
jgi:hypothetical protein